MWYGQHVDDTVNVSEERHLSRSEKRVEELLSRAAGERVGRDRLVLLPREMDLRQREVGAQCNALLQNGQIELLQ